MDDVRFLAMLVHRGHLDRTQAEAFVPALRSGGTLDDLLVRAGWSDEKIARLRRTQAGLIPEIPGYEIVEHVGTGGTSDVFRARDKRKNGLIVALKVLKPECAAVASVRLAFVAEARLLERLDHPNLVMGLGVAKSGKTYFSRMELIEGRTLLELLDDGRRFDEHEALSITLAVAEVLQYLEREHVVHRDVKPGNIMLGGDGTVKLIDLGFAADQGAARAASAGDSTVGTVAYLSPEQARGASLADTRSDIYSLGVSLFHIVIGRLPFESSDDQELMRMQVMEHLSSPELKSRGMSPHMHYFIEKMMAKEAGHRYQTMAHLIDDVRAQVDGRASLDFESELPQRRRRGRRR